LGRWVKY